MAQNVAEAARTICHGESSQSLARLARAKLRTSSKEARGHTCGLSRCGCVASAPSKARCRSKRTTRSPKPQPLPKAFWERAAEAAAASAEETTRPTPLVPIPALAASRGIEVAPLEMPSADTPHALTSALQRSQILLREMSLLDLSDDVAKDSTCGNFDKGGEQPNEEHLDVPVDGLDANVLDASLIEHEEDEVEEQLMLLKLASDMWSQVSADVAFRAAADDETTSLPTSRGSQSPSFSLPSLDDISVDSRATSLFRKAFNAILLESGEASTKSEFCSDDVDGHSVDEISRAKAFLVKVLSPIGEKIRNDDRERAAGYPAAAKVVGKKIGRGGLSRSLAQLCFNGMSHTAAFIVHWLECGSPFATVIEPNISGSAGYGQCFGAQTDCASSDSIADYFGDTTLAEGDMLGSCR